MANQRQQFDSYDRWRCMSPNNCSEKCELDSSTEPTGCVYSDEKDILKDAKIWMLLDKEG